MGCDAQLAAGRECLQRNVPMEMFVEDVQGNCPGEGNIGGRKKVNTQIYKYTHRQLYY